MRVCCVLLAVAFVGPRFALFVLFLFSEYLTRAFDTFFIPFLGFLFLPWTTLAYAVAQNSFGGPHDIGLLLVILGVLADVGVFGGGARYRNA